MWRGYARPLGILLLSLACFLAAQGTGLRLFLHLCYLLLALLVIAFIWAYFNLRGLQVEREVLTQRAYVGEYARERLTLYNRWRIPKLWIEIHDQSDMPEHGSGFVTFLDGHQRSRWVARTPCTVRGKFHLGPALLTSGDPFGIWQLERRLSATSEIIVYPQIVDLPEFTLPDAELTGGQDVRSRTYHVTQNVSTVRNYAPGDSFNRIHWRSTARNGNLMVKEFELDPSADIYLVLDLQERAVVKDTRPAGWRNEEPAPASALLTPLPDRRHAGPAPEDVSTEEYAVMAAASLAQRLLQQNRQLGLLAWGQHREIIAPEREARQLFKILEALAVLRAHGSHSLAEVLLAENQRFNRNCSLVIITASVDEQWTTALRQLLYRGVRATVLFVDPLSFGGWRDPDEIFKQLTEMRVATYRLSQGQPLEDALRTPIVGPAGTRRYAG